LADLAAAEPNLAAAAAGMDGEQEAQASPVLLAKAATALTTIVLG
jgi:hypothetical protein